jgi:hypothetical protein
VPNSNTPDIRFALYAEAWKPGVWLSDLEKLGSELDLLARVENSGSEGEYCEVARWDVVWHWTRYAFCKFLGGEGLTAQEAADRINNACWHKGKAPLIHGLPNYDASCAATRTTRAT